MNSPYGYFLICKMLLPVQTYAGPSLEAAEGEAELGATVRLEAIHGRSGQQSMLPPVSSFMNCPNVYLHS